MQILSLQVNIIEKWKILANQTTCTYTTLHSQKMPYIQFKMKLKGKVLVSLILILSLITQQSH